MELDKEKKGALPLKPQSRKKRPDAMITIYGRNPVLEALLDPSLSFFRLHLADSNKPADVILRIPTLQTSGRWTLLGIASKPCPGFPRMAGKTKALLSTSLLPLTRH